MESVRSLEMRIPDDGDPHDDPHRFDVPCSDGSDGASREPRLDEGHRHEHGHESTDRGGAVLQHDARLLAPLVWRTRRQPLSDHQCRYRAPRADAWRYWRPARAAQIEKYIMSQYAHLAQTLKDTTMGASNLLENTVIYGISELAEPQLPRHEELSHRADGPCRRQDQRQPPLPQDGAQGHRAHAHPPASHGHERHHASAPGTRPARRCPRSSPEVLTRGGALDRLRRRVPRSLRTIAACLERRHRSARTAKPGVATPKSEGVWIVYMEVRILSPRPHQVREGGSTVQLT